MQKNQKKIKKIKQLKKAVIKEALEKLDRYNKELIKLDDNKRYIEFKTVFIDRKIPKYKYCYLCKRHLSYKLFSKDKHQHDGLNYCCKECNIKRRKKYEY